MALLRAGMNDGAAVNFVRAEIRRLKNVEEDRRQRRLFEIPGMVSTARAKLNKEGQTQQAKTQPALTLRRGWDAVRPQPMGTVVCGLLHQGSLTLFYGPPKSGKSFLLTSTFLAIAAGDTEWMGHSIIRPGPVLYVACEGHASFWKRLKAAAITRGSDEETFPANFMLATGRPSLIRLDYKSHAAVPNPDDVLAAIANCKALGYSPHAVAIDTVFRSFGSGNVNAPDT
jgi:AAA domain